MSHIPRAQKDLDLRPVNGNDDGWRALEVAMSEKKNVIGTADEKDIGVMPTVALPGESSNLQEIVRDALKANGLDPDTGKTPLIQPRTLPMIEPQPLKAPAIAKEEPPAAPASAPSAASAAKTTAIVPRRSKSRTSAIVLGLMGICVVASAGAAAHLARTKSAVRPASAAVATHEPPAPATQATTESAVKIASGARPAEAAPATPASEQPTTAPATEPAPAVAAAAPAETASDEKKEERRHTRRRAPKAEAPSSQPATTAAAEAKPREEPKPVVKTASAAEEKKPEEKKAAPAAAGSVDAILQQQLNSAIP
jgi:hypothetical protein